jgi:hypothetical protein
MLKLLPLLVVGLLALPSASCTKAPPNLTPKGKAAFQKLAVLKDLDLLRDIAIAANDNGVLSEADTRKVVQYHKSTVLIMQASDLGWKAAVEQGLTELKTNLTSPGAQRLLPYITLITTVLVEVGS